MCEKKFELEDDRFYSKLIPRPDQDLEPTNHDSSKYLFCAPSLVEQEKQDCCLLLLELVDSISHCSVSHSVFLGLLSRGELDSA